MSCDPKEGSASFTKKPRLVEGIIGPGDINSSDKGKSESEQPAAVVTKDEQVPTYKDDDDYYSEDVDVDGDKDDIKIKEVYELGHKPIKTESPLQKWSRGQLTDRMHRLINSCIQSSSDILDDSRTSNSTDTAPITASYASSTHSFSNAAGNFSSNFLPQLDGTFDPECDESREDTSAVSSYPSPVFTAHNSNLSTGPSTSNGAHFATSLSSTYSQHPSMLPSSSSQSAIFPTQLATALTLTSPITCAGYSDENQPLPQLYSSGAVSSTGATSGYPTPLFPLSSDSPAKSGITRLSTPNAANINTTANDGGSASGSFPVKTTITGAHFQLAAKQPTHASGVSQLSTLPPSGVRFALQTSPLSQQQQQRSSLVSGQISPSINREKRRVSLESAEPNFILPQAPGPAAWLVHDEKADLISGFVPVSFKFEYALFCMV
ncbi:unnamed protein product [Protopolystoma xenopodis]|uniref:Uncharacterized protein n=1 Tax=Protopolystoma xenopodis TaxID=117903 RepID=A0A448WDI1_9PLAT|nr:unnamed protein product [Protopolystoma xenopodis]